MRTLLAEYRREAGFSTQEALSVTLGIQRSTIAKWETGVSYPRAPLMSKLAKRLNVSEGQIIAAITTARTHES